MVKLWISKSTADALLRQFEGRQARTPSAEPDRAFEELHGALSRALRPEHRRRAGRWGGLEVKTGVRGR